MLQRCRHREVVIKPLGVITVFFPGLRRFWGKEAAHTFGSQAGRVALYGRIFKSPVYVCDTLGQVTPVCLGWRPLEHSNVNISGSPGVIRNITEVPQ